MALFSPAPLGLAYLGTILHRKGYDVTIYDENRQKVFLENSGRILPQVLESDFVGGLVISPCARRAEKLFRELRSQKPGTRTAVGGPHMAGKEQAEHFAAFTDAVVQGEGEKVIEQVVNGRINGVVRGGQVENLDGLPVPNLDLIHRYGRKVGLEYLYPRSVPISTTRGCPRRCEFCAVSNIHGTKIRRRSAGNVISELEKRCETGRERGQKYGIFIADDNFSFSREKTEVVHHNYVGQVCCE